jgi:hypothetical protein
MPGGARGQALVLDVVVDQEAVMEKLHGHRGL